jgi:hypothetical protein
MVTSPEKSAASTNRILSSRLNLSVLLGGLSLDIISLLLEQHGPGGAVARSVLLKVTASFSINWRSVNAERGDKNTSGSTLGSAEWFALPGAGGSICCVFPDSTLICKNIVFSWDVLASAAQ